METVQYQFKDDGKIPNSVFPLIVFKKAFPVADNLADVIEEKFAKNNWKNAWRNGVYSYHHYHSTSHEVLGVYKGTAQFQLGGEHGKEVEVSAGDVIIIPAGIGHKKLSASDDFAIVGAYPDGMDYDLLTGKSEEREKALINIAKVPFPDNDPFFGKEGGINEFWK